MTTTTVPATTAQSFGSISRNAAVLAAGAGAFSLILLAALHAIRPDLNPEWHVLSEYGVGSYGWVMSVYFFSAAAACVALVIAIARHGVIRLGLRIGLVFLAGAGLGLAMAGAFPMDPITDANATFSGTMHEVAGAIGVPCEVIAALVCGYALNGLPLWNRVRLPMLGAAHATWIFTVLMFVALSILMHTHALEGPWMIGLANRLFMIAFTAWIAIASSPLAFSGVFASRR